LGKASVRYFGAKWGYGVGWGKHKFITVVKSPRELARELHLKAVTKEYLSRNRAFIRVPFLGHYVVGERITRDEAQAKKIPHAIVYLLIKDKKGNYFLQKRASAKNEYPDLYTVSASGHVKHLESFEKAAKREAEEELGVKLRNMHPLWKKPARLDANNPHRVFFPFVADYDGEFKLDAKEVNVKESGFFNEQQIAALAAEKKLIPHAHKFLEMVKNQKARN